MPVESSLSSLRHVACVHVYVQYVYRNQGLWIHRSKTKNFVVNAPLKIGSRTTHTHTRAHLCSLERASRPTMPCDRETVTELAKRKCLMMRPLENFFCCTSELPSVLIFSKRTFCSRQVTRKLTVAAIRRRMRRPVTPNVTRPVSQRRRLSSHCRDVIKCDLFQEQPDTVGAIWSFFFFCGLIKRRRAAQARLPKCVFCDAQVYLKKTKQKTWSLFPLCHQLLKVRSEKPFRLETWHWVE